LVEHSGAPRVAFEWAEQARETRRLMREDLQAARTDLDAVLASATTDPMVGQVRLLWALESLPGARKTDTRRRLAELDLDPATPLEALDADQRATLLAEFPMESRP
jgi:hypothetical protein